jgi:hypothetical protein
MEDESKMGATERDCEDWRAMELAEDRVRV